MILEGNTDIILSCESLRIKGEEIAILNLADGKAIALSKNAIAVYTNVSAIHNDFGQGLLDMADLPPNIFFG